MTKIENVIDLYKSQFPFKWLDNYKWDKTNQEVSFNAFIQKLNDFEQTAFFYISQSILSGEYIPKINTPKSLDLFYELLCSGEILEDESNEYRLLAIKQFNLISYEIEEWTKKYKYLLTILYNKYVYSNVQYLVNAYQVKHSQYDQSTINQYFEILYDVTCFDHMLISDKRTIIKLILHHSVLETEIKSPSLSANNLLVLQILDEKCLFLIKKILVEDNNEFDYLIDFIPHHFDAKSLDFKYILRHNESFEFYRLESYSNEDFGRNLDVLERSGKLLIGKYTLLLKYYKDSRNTDLQQIDNIIKSFNSCYDSLYQSKNSRPIDKYALNTLKNYMYNCRLSYRMKTNAYEFEDLKKDINKILSIQQKVGIYDFYPFKKAIEYIFKKIKTNADIEISEFNNYISLLNVCIDKYSATIEWCNAIKYYPIQAPYIECLSTVKDFGAVYVASSFCRPIKYQKLKEELNAYINERSILNNIIEIKKGKKELNNIKTEISNSRIKEIEMLSFFTAIITFLFGTIEFFAENHNTDFIHLIYSIFGLGAILLIFVSGIHLVTVRRESKFCDYFKHPRALFCIITILLSFVLIVWLVCKINVLQSIK